MWYVDRHVGCWSHREAISSRVAKARISPQSSCRISVHVNILNNYKYDICIYFMKYFVTLIVCLSVSIYLRQFLMKGLTFSRHSRRPMRMVHTNFKIPWGEGINSFVRYEHFVKPTVVLDWVVQGVISDWVVQGVISDWVVQGVISDWVVQGVISDWVVQGVISDWVVQGVISDWVVQGVLSDWVVQGVISDWVVQGVISDWVVQGVISDWVVQGAISDWVVQGVLSDWVVQGVISDWVVQGVISDWVVQGVISDWVVQGVISDWVVQGVKLLQWWYIQYVCCYSCSWLYILDMLFPYAASCSQTCGLLSKLNI